MNSTLSPTKNSLTSQSRAELLYRLKLKRQLDYRVARRSPRAFRLGLQIDPDDARFFRGQIQSWQQSDFAALDDAWRKLAGQTVAPRFQRAYIERPRGHAKTFDMAVQIAWILEHARSGVYGLAAAADRDQAGLIWDAMQKIVRQNSWSCRSLDFRKHLVVNRRTGSRLEVISSDVQSSWGALPDFVICDELCHWEKPQMWHSLLSSAAKRPDCLLVVLTNAGVGRGWQWDVREAARNSKDWYFSSLNGPHAPWIRPDRLREQQELLPKPVFERLWRNLWQHSDGEYVSLAEVEACRSDELRMRDRGQPGVQYVAAVDYAEKHDFTAGVILHREGDRFIVDRMDVAVPQPDAPVKVSWVDDWIERTAATFQNVSFVVDEYQLLSTIQRLESRFDIRRFDFSAGRGNHALAVTLRQLILHQAVRWYPGCGTVTGSAVRDDLETELAALLLKQKANGYCRFTHPPGGRHHDDRAFALGAACLTALKNARPPAWLHTTPPTRNGEIQWAFTEEL